MRGKEPYKRMVVFLAGFTLWALMTGLWAIVWLYEYADEILRPFGYKGNWLVFVVYGVLLFFLTRLYGGFRMGRDKTSGIIFSAVFSMLAVNIITYLQTCLVGRALMNPIPFAGMSAGHFLIILLWAPLAGKVYKKLFPPHQMLLVYGGSELAQSLISKMSDRHEKYRIQEAISTSVGLDAITGHIFQYQAVILCDVKSPDRNALLKLCFDTGIRVYITPKISDILMRGADEISLFDTPLLLIRGYGLRFEQRLAKRAIDILLSLIGIVVASPFMLLTALAVKLQDGGPVLFKQERCTRDNKTFMVIKFRSMITDAEKDGKPIPAVDSDPRITSVGRFIRTTRLDELPQLFNILKGEMSIVGPRPERVEHVEKYTAEIPEFSFRSKVKAGLTGYAQIVGRYNTSAYDKLKMDLMYISNYTILEDIKLILMTFKILFVRESTKGFEENGAPPPGGTVKLPDNPSDPAPKRRVKII